MTEVLALDVGSSSVRAQRFDERAEPVDELKQEHYEGRDPDEIVELVRKVVDGRDEGADAVGISCFGHSLLALDGDGRPLTEMLGWRDTRSAAAAEWLRAPARSRGRPRAHRRVPPSVVLAGEARAGSRETEPEVFRARRPLRLVLATTSTRGSSAASRGRASRSPPAPGCSTSQRGRGTASSSTCSASTRSGCRVSRPSRAAPGIRRSRRRLLESRRRLHRHAARAALMVGTSGALRILYETERPQPRPGLFLYRLDERRVVEGGALSDGGNLHAWLERDARRSRRGSLAERARTTTASRSCRSSAASARRAGIPTERGTVHGLTFDTTPLDIRQAALEGVAFRFAAIADLLPELEEVVATGGGLLGDPRLDPADGRRARAARHGVEGRGGVAARRRGCDARTARLRSWPRRRSARCSIRGRRGPRHIVRPGSGSSVSTRSFVAKTDIEQRSIDTIRTLAMDAVQQANAGHPGTAMALAPLAYLLYTEVMDHNPANPHWPDRDRFVLSAGHACILQYATLHLAGLQPLARGAEALPAVGVAHAGPSRGAPHAGSRGDDGPARPGFRERRRLRDRRALPRRALQPARTTRSSTIASTASAPTAT